MYGGGGGWGEDALHTQFDKFWSGSQREEMRERERERRLERYLVSTTCHENSCSGVPGTGMLFNNVKL